MIQDELRALYDQMSDEEKNENSVLKGGASPSTLRGGWSGTQFAMLPIRGKAL